MINQAPIIKTDKILLRSPQPSDIEARMIVGKPVEFVKMCGGETGNLPPFTIEDAKGWYENVTNTPCEWIIEYFGKMIGIARLTVDKIDNRARYAIGIFDDTLYGQGIGTEVTHIVLEYAFKTLNLHRVDLRVLEFNKRAIRCYEKCGFTQEGVEREGAYIDGQYYSDIMMSILEREYNSIKKDY